MRGIRIEKVSITETGTECVVNAANEDLLGGGGVCGAIFRAAGWDRMQAACDAFGHCDTGSAVATPAFGLDAEYVIHAVGPVWTGGSLGEPQKLYSSYRSSLDLVKELGCRSVAFPLISAGIYGYPADRAWKEALKACGDFLEEHPDLDLDILFAVIDDRMLKMGREELERQSK